MIDSQCRTLSHLAPAEASLHHQVTTSTTSKLQFAIGAGDRAADYFFDSMTDIGLHEHMERSKRDFIFSLNSNTSYFEEPLRDLAISVDAFVAGYLLRVKRELRVMSKRSGSGFSDSRISGCLASQ